MMCNILTLDAELLCVDMLTQKKKSPRVYIMTQGNHKITEHYVDTV